MIRGNELRWHKDLSLLVLDCDGTLTDSGMYYGENGDVFKRFDTRDGVGIRQWMQQGREVAIITGEDSQAVLNRAEKLGIEEVILGSENKAKDLKYIMEDRNLERDNVIVMGDDINDLPMLSLCRFFACPSDAHWRVLECADLVTEAKGGYGAVRELVDFFLGSPIDLVSW